MNLKLPKATVDMFPLVNLVRHGRIPDYAMDHALTSRGETEALARGRELAETVLPGETIAFYSGPARRARQTAALIRDGLQAGLAELAVEATILPVVAVEDDLENCQCYLGGHRYDLTFAILDAARWQSRQANPPADAAACAEFLDHLWHVAPDSMGYWLDYSGPGAESPEAVNKRTLSFLANRLKNGPDQTERQRHVAVTHSGNLRALLRLAFGYDIGSDMPYIDVITVTKGRIFYREAMAELPDESQPGPA